MKKNILFSFFTLSLFSLFFQPLQAQRDYSLLLKSGVEVLPENIDVFITNSGITSDDVFNNRIYRLLQFYEIPDQPALNRIEASGIRLLQYIPNYTYIASLPAQFDLSQLPGLQVRHVSALPSQAKFHKYLLQETLPSWALNGDNIEVDLTYHADVAPLAIENYFNSIQIPVLYSSPNYSYITLNVPVASLEDIAALPFVSYVEAIPAPAVPDDQRGQSLHRSNLLNGASPNSLKFDGTGVAICCRDDGFVGPHIDYKGRINNQTNDMTGNHGDGVSGIMCGAGNIDPAIQGMAPGAELYVIQYRADFMDNTLFLHTINDVMITNSSYSNGCNAGYTNTAVTVDRQMWENTSLFHIFSAGNSNNNNCGYGAGDQFGNITGGHKIGKNVIATANVDARDIIDPSSSHGPSEDGRIKPDIAAHGRNQLSTDSDNQYMSFGGTSAAAPSIAGVTTQLYHAYKTMNGEQNPPAALIKTIMLNTADEIGNKGPDYFFGWGRINAYKAYKALEEGRYMTDSITQGANKTHTIVVPPNTRQVKIMTYWAEPSAFAGSAKALINDLNTSVSDPNGQTRAPWLLSSAPNASLLGAPATKASGDNLNNMEQVSIDDPIAGNYALTINGAVIPNGSLTYIVTYEFIKDEIMVTYPQGGEGFVPQEIEVIRWDAPEGMTNFVVEYSADNGTTWSPIRTANPTDRFANWAVPDTLSGEARIRVSNGTLTDMSDASFTIMARPAVSIHRICQAYTTISWTPVLGATGYDVFSLGDKYMDSVGTTAADTFAIMGVPHNQINWFAVRAKGPNGLLARRTIAIPSGPGLDNCQPIAVIPAFNAPDVVCAGTTVDYLDSTQNFPQSWQWIVLPNTGHRFVSGTSTSSQNPRIQFLAPGTYNIIMAATNEAGSQSVSKTIQVDPAPQSGFNHSFSGPTVSFTNTSLQTTSYIWDFGDGNTEVAENPVHTYSAPGSYQVKLVSIADCGKDSITQTVQAFATAVGELFDDISVEIYPNPGKGIFTLSMEGAESGDVEIEVFSVQGQLIRNIAVNIRNGSTQQTLDLTGMTAGIYFLKIHQEERSGTVKLMIK